MFSDRPFPDWNSGNNIGKANAGEDEFFMQYFNNKKQGLIIDVGAADGVTGSNSFRLINEMNWKGILIEPFVPFYDYLNKIYKSNNNVEIYNCAFDDQEQETRIYFKNNQTDIGLTSLIEKYSDRPSKDFENSQIVHTKLFNNLIKDTRIDILSLDTEAKDWDIIKTIDFDKYDIRLICTEIGWQDLNEKIFDFLNKKGYAMLHKTMDNFIFEKNGR